MQKLKMKKTIHFGMVKSVRHLFKKYPNLNEESARKNQEIINC